MSNKVFEQTSVDNRIQKSGFDLSHEVKISCRANLLLPIMCEEVLPGDSFKNSTEIFARIAPMLAPLMHRVNIYTHAFFVPNRILTSNWEKFITGGFDPEGVAPDLPVVTVDSTRSDALPNYFGLPSLESGKTPYGVSALPFAAYQAIYDHWYRDANLTPPLGPTELGMYYADSLGDDDLCTVRARAWEKDYFTSALPFPQRGPDVNLPIGVEYRSSTVVRDAVTDAISGAASENLFVSGGVTNTASDNGVYLDNLKDDALTVTINELRMSSALQRWFERGAKGGVRYVEQLRAFWNVKSSDARLNRPEYIGGGRQPLQISEVLNTTGTASAPQGDMTGHGMSVGGKHAFRYSAEEHGWILVIMSIMPQLSYMSQGIARKFTRFTREDYPWPDFANLGEQPILNRELFYDPDNLAEGTQVFGYQQRYAELKYGCSYVTGDFRDSLEFWHLARKYATTPVLNDSFIASADAPWERILAAGAADDYFWIQAYHNLKVVRALPYFSNPSLS